MRAKYWIMVLQQFKGSLQDLLKQSQNAEQIALAVANQGKQKTINVLCFLPSYGGFFMAGLLSLNSNTVPIKPVTDDAHRADAYRYYPLGQRTDNNGNVVFVNTWLGYYADIKSPLDLMLELEKSHDYNTTTIPIHPVEFFQHPVTAEDIRTKINYIQITLDPKDQYVIDRFRTFFSVETREGEDQLDKQFTDQYTPIQVSLSEIIKGEKEFLAEYKKLCAAIGQEPNNSALELYRAWYKQRKFDLFKT